MIGGYSAPILEVGSTTVASMLKEQGYRTCMIGKWHLGMDFTKTADFYEKEGFATCDGIDYSGIIRQSPTAHGFDYYYGISGSLDMPPYIYIENMVILYSTATMLLAGSNGSWKRQAFLGIPLWYIPRITAAGRSRISMN